MLLDTNILIEVFKGNKDNIMRIGIYFENIKPESGGGYAFLTELLHKLELNANLHEIFIFQYQDIKSNNPNIKYINLLENKSDDSSSPHKKRFNIKAYIRSVLIKVSVGKMFEYHKGLIDQMLDFRNNAIRQSNYYENYDNILNRACSDNEIDLMWFPTSWWLPVVTPYIYTLWDLGHRTLNCFPELNVTGWTWQQREDYNRNILQRASIILTGTQVGKQEAMYYYSLNDKNMKVIPFPIPDIAKIDKEEMEKTLVKYKIKSQYIFYPALFWPHKNHVSILYALKLFKEKYNLDIKIVFTGCVDHKWKTDYNHFNYVKYIAKYLDIDIDVIFLGFIDKQEIYHLYSGAIALVYGSLLGPDNFPPLEAMKLNCPVIADRNNGTIEQLGEAAYLIDMLNEEEIANAIYLIYTSDKFRSELISKGKEKCENAKNDYIDQINTVFASFEKIRRTWGNINKSYE